MLSLSGKGEISEVCLTRGWVDVRLTIPIGDFDVDSPTDTHFSKIISISEICNGYREELDKSDLKQIQVKLLDLENNNSSNVFELRFGSSSVGAYVGFREKEKTTDIYSEFHD